MGLVDVEVRLRQGYVRDRWSRALFRDVQWYRESCMIKYNNGLSCFNFELFGRLDFPQLRSLICVITPDFIFVHQMARCPTSCSLGPLSLQKLLMQVSCGWTLEGSTTHTLEDHMLRSTRRASILVAELLPYHISRHLVHTSTTLVGLILPLSYVSNSSPPFPASSHCRSVLTARTRPSVPPSSALSCHPLPPGNFVFSSRPTPAPIVSLSGSDRRNLHRSIDPSVPYVHISKPSTLMR